MASPADAKMHNSNSKENAEGANVDKIRDILFGSQMRDYEKRFVRLEETVTKAVETLREDMTKRLKLSPPQVTQLGAILDDTRTKFHEEHDRSKQQLVQIHDDQVQKIHEILTPAQLPEYDKFREEREKQKDAHEAKERQSNQPK